MDERHMKWVTILALSVLGALVAFFLGVTFTGGLEAGVRVAPYVAGAMVLLVLIPFLIIATWAA